VLVGVASVASRLVGSLAKIVGLPARRMGGAAGRLAYQNALRNPARTAATAAALMIGLTLVSFVAVLAKGVHGSVDTALRKQVDADWVVTSKNGWSGFPIAAGAAIERALPGAKVTSVRGDRGLVGKEQVNVNAVDPATLDGMVRFQWRDGSDATLAELGTTGALVKRSFAKANHLALGQEFTLRSSAGTPGRFTVAGIFQPPRVMELMGGVVLSQQAFDRIFPRPANKLTLVTGDVPRAAIAQAIAGFPDTKLATEAEYVKDQSAFMSTLLNLLYVLLALSVVVSLFGMVNTLVLSVFERTRELGMLRAVGMTRRQARRMIRQESVITSLIGAALGLPLGIALAAAVTGAIAHLGIGFSVPVGSLVAFVVVAVVAGILAAVAPARRAGKLNVLAALQYE
jgi:putative ABC transport system permease protein